MDRDIELKAFLASRATSTHDGFSSSTARTECVVNSSPELHATPTWAGQGAPLGWAGGFDDPGGGGWRYAAKRSLYCRATTIDTALPRVEPMAIGRSLRLVSSSDGSSPSFERAIRRPPRNQGRTDAGMCPSKMVVARLKRASAPRPGMKEEGAPGGASGRVVERKRYAEERYSYRQPPWSAAESLGSLRNQTSWKWVRERGSRGGSGGA